MQWGSSYGVPIAEALFDFVDLVQLVLEVEAAEEERHDSAKTQAERLRAVVVLLQRVAQDETGDQSDDPAGQADEAARYVLVGLLVVEMAMKTPYEPPKLSTISTVAMM